ncbi:2'-5' RNA ligase family protein [Arthrobacter sp. CG_A4]|uniref:2'-5' RNA ligase family protein n=1 Tax=Arthrobacter sp. CG_A4 TaxID=3071706 RepID=UPI002DF9D6F8|nr:hypothetical protein [Arthrobacter sp. CG_A4]
MRNLIVVAFLEPVAEGFEFLRDDWPMHITLVRFDVADQPPAPAPAPAPAGEADRVPAAGDPLAERIAGRLTEPVAVALGSRITAGGESGFGRSGVVPVTLIAPSLPLQELHEALVAVVAELSGRIPTPGYTLAGYRPHVSHRGGDRVSEGDELVLSWIALLDMAPDGGHTTRRILKLWSA